MSGKTNCGPATRNERSFGGAGKTHTSKKAKVASQNKARRTIADITGGLPKFVDLDNLTDEQAIKIIGSPKSTPEQVRVARLTLPRNASDRHRAATDIQNAKVGMVRRLGQVDAERRRSAAAEKEEAETAGNIRNVGRALGALGKKTGFTFSDEQVSVGEALVRDGMTVQQALSVTIDSAVADGDIPQEAAPFYRTVLTSDDAKERSAAMDVLIEKFGVKVKDAASLFARGEDEAGQRAGVTERGEREERENTRRASTAQKSLAKTARTNLSGLRTRSIGGLKQKVSDEDVLAGMSSAIDVRGADAALKLGVGSPGDLKLFRQYIAAQMKERQPDATDAEIAAQMEARYGK